MIFMVQSIPIQENYSGTARDSLTSKDPVFYSDGHKTERADKRVNTCQPYTANSYPVKRKELTMQSNPSTDHTDTTDDPTQPFDMEREDWELVFEPYEGNAYAAIRMGFNIRTLRKHLDAQLFKPRPVMEALDLAMEVLFPFTDFHKASFDLFLKFTDGQLTFEEEQMLKALGVKI